MTDDITAVTDMIAKIEDDMRRTTGIREVIGGKATTGTAELELSRGVYGMLRRMQTQRDDAWARVAVLQDALDTVAQAYGSNPSDALADLSEADYLRYYLGGLRSLAREALAKP